MIREINESDFEPFFHLMGEVECGKYYDPSNQKHTEWLKKFIKIQFFRGIRFFGYYNEDGTPVGFVNLLIDEYLSGWKKKSEVLDLGVFKEYRRTGIGTKLLMHAVDFAREEGLHCVYVATYAADYKVVSFYGKSGFTPVATLPDVHGAGEEGMVYMRKLLKKKPTK